MTVDDQKREYLLTIRDVVMTLSRMRAMLAHELCPENGPPRRGDLKGFARLRKGLNGHLKGMRAAERAVGHSYGVEALLGFEPHDAIRTCLCVLTAKALSSEIVDTETVSALATLCAGREPEGLIAIHAAFGRQGVLHKHTFTVDRRKTHFGEMELPSLREDAVQTLVGLEPESNTTE